MRSTVCRLFFFNDTATTEIYTLSLHDALPICAGWARPGSRGEGPRPGQKGGERGAHRRARRSEEHSLNSSHANISYAVFCLKKNNCNHLYRHCSSRHDKQNVRVLSPIRDVVTL